jgi:uncharacterized protein YydD (DUF2326 family)
MNVKLTTEQLSRIQSLVIDLRNLNACASQIGASKHTILAVIERGYGNNDTIGNILQFCDKVEGLTTHNDAD